MVTKTIKFDVNETNVPWICEGGLRKLVLKSKAKQADIFQDWVCEEVLPSIWKKGTWAAPLQGQQIKLLSETDLHYKVLLEVFNSKANFSGHVNCFQTNVA